MRYRLFGRTGVQVSAVTLGGMNLGPQGGTERTECVGVVHRALDLGIDAIDTADVYSHGQSEEIIGAALSGGRRDGVFLATKFHGRMGDGANERGSSRRWIHRAVEGSLRRLRTDWIDLYQAHRPDPAADVDETLGALSTLVQQGKIRYFGTSTFSGADLVEAQWVAERRHRERPVSEQPPYSLLVRGVEREILPLAQRHGLAVLSWSPLAGGWLSGRYLDGRVPPRAATSPHRYDPEHSANAAKRAAVVRLQALADEVGLPLAQLALAFVLEHPAITSAIIGPRTQEQLESQVAAADLVLPAEILDAIDAIVPPGLDVNPADVGHVPRALLDPDERRRVGVVRSAGHRAVAPGP
jgi:aryl-alcohol dehydrogenase-like predicted oxidoreductase